MVLLVEVVVQVLHILVQYVAANAWSLLSASQSSLDNFAHPGASWCIKHAFEVVVLVLVLVQLSHSMGQ